MVVLAIQFKNNRGDGPIGNGNDDVGTLLCVEELRKVCEGLESSHGIDVEYQEAGSTYDELTSADAAPTYDGWLTLTPWPAMTDEIRTGQPPIFGEVSAPLAATS